MSAWQLFGRKALSNFRLGTHWNPSDDPSRLAALRERAPGEPWQEGLITCEEGSTLTKLAAIVAGEEMVPAAPRRPLRAASQFSLALCGFEPRSGPWKDLTFTVALNSLGIPACRPLTLVKGGRQREYQAEATFGRQIREAEAGIRCRLFNRIYTWLGQGKTDVENALAAELARTATAAGVQALVAFPFTDKMMRRLDAYNLSNMKYVARVSRRGLQPGLYAQQVSKLPSTSSQHHHNPQHYLTLKYENHNPQHNLTQTYDFHHSQNYLMPSHDDLYNVQAYDESTLHNNNNEQRLITKSKFRSASGSSEPLLIILTSFVWQHCVEIPDDSSLALTVLNSKPASVSCWLEALVRC